MVVLSNEGNDQGLTFAGTGGVASTFGEPTALIHSASADAGGAPGPSVPGEERSAGDLDGPIPPYLLSLGSRYSHRSLLRQAAHAAIISLAGLPTSDGIECRARMRSRCAMMARNFSPTFLPHAPLTSLLQQWVC
jgi:hypothetical protein